jgi:GNAT superfamily N-acetyltransferase
MIPEDVRRFAEDPSAFGTIREASGYERVLTDRYCLLFGPVPTFTSISHLRLEPEDVPGVLAEVRATVATRDHREAMWWIGSSATPSDLVDLLQARGLVPDEREGSEPHATTMALVEEPPEAPPDVVARRVADLDEYRLANRVTSAAFGSPEALAAWDAVVEERFAAEQAGHAPRTYLAFLDGEPVAVARALFDPDCPAVLMIGGGVVPHARGRGVYRALVRTRWNDAVAAGTSALCTQAGHMSRPILERLGFQAVAEQEVLLDPTTC